LLTDKFGQSAVATQSGWHPEPAEGVRVHTVKEEVMSDESEMPATVQ
jgi:hypothetical protein